MMSLSRTILRSQAKKIYKEQAKSVPKRNRIPFSKFYKQFVNMRTSRPVDDEAVAPGEDFDFGNIINVNAISDDDVEFDTDDGVEAEKFEEE